MRLETAPTERTTRDWHSGSHLPVPTNCRQAVPGSGKGGRPLTGSGSVGHMSDDAAIPTESGYTEDGVPTFDAVREKIENRYASGSRTNRRPRSPDSFSSAFSTVSSSMIVVYVM